METFTGGARFGWANASWPFATLTVQEDRLSNIVTFVSGLLFVISLVALF